MASFSAKTDSKYHVRSISLPTRSHPTTVRVEEELNKLRTWEASSSEAICVGLSGLEELYNCMDELLNLQSTQEALSQQQQQHEKWVDELMDGSVKLLDICSITREEMLLVKEHVRDLQSALRRRKGDLGIEKEVAIFICFRKKMKKDTKKLIATMKQINLTFSPNPDTTDGSLSSLIRVLQEVNVTTISIFESLLSFLSAPLSKQKQTGWSLVSKLMMKKKGVVESASASASACEEDKLQNVNEFRNADHAISHLYKYSSDEVSYADKLQNAHKSLESLENCIEGIEQGLEGIFRRLIRTRASLLNILSQ